MQIILKNLLILFLLYNFHSFGQVTIYQEDFNAGIGTFSAVNVSGAVDQWTATGGFMEVDVSGSTNDEDWLISTAINMDAQGNEYFMFDYNDLHPGALLELYYSTDYNNGGTPIDISSATWTNIPLKLIDIDATTCFSTLFQRHPAIDVSTITGTSVYFAFKYTGPASVSKRYRIDNVHIDADYYASLVNGTNCATLKSDLHALIAVQTDRIRYSSSSYDVWDAILHTDRRMNDAGTAEIVWDMFTDFPNATGEFEFDHCTHRDQGSCPGGEGNCYNREHTFPRSWWGGGTTLSDTINTDMHHIYASDRSMNSTKSNYPPGVVTAPVAVGSNGVSFGGNASYPCTGTNYFEPIDEFKGDYARTYFYVVTRYQHKMAAWQTLNARGDCFMDGTSYPSIEPWALNVLLQWHAADPVSQKEIDHNNAVYAIQGNRNPYIDNPDFVFLVWGDEFGLPCTTTALPVELVEFSVEKNNRNVELYWSTITEVNSDYFEIERSFDLLNWKEIGRVNAAGNSNLQLDYSFIDYSVHEKSIYYRLKQVDFNGEIVYSQVKSVNFEDEYDLFAYPNPVKDILTIRMKNIDVSSIQLIDMLGRDVTQRVVFDVVSKGEIRLDMNNLNSNMYLLKIGFKQIKIIKE